jgi:hypothetical protein
MAGERGWTRDQLLSEAARLGAGIVASGAGFELLRSGVAQASPIPGARHYVSRPDLRPPRLTMRYSGQPVSDGYLFMSPNSGPGQRGVMIVDREGDIVWFHPTTPHTAMNFRPGRYHGKPVLTWWEGKADNGLGRGTHVVLDETYREIIRIPAGGGRQSDLHEFIITPHNTALVTSYELRNVDLRSIGGPSSGPAISGIVQELALPSGKVLFEWNSFDHVQIDETHAPYMGHPIDYFHINSIDLTADGNFLVSARNTWGVYKIDRRTGEVLWRLGGKRSSFQMGKGTSFAWQHDARHHGNGLITIFDDGGLPFVEPQARALVIKLDGPRERAHLVRQYTHRPGRIRSRFMGNAQLVGNGNLIVGWGSEPYVTEFAPNGRILLDVQLPKGGQNYRAFRVPWTGRPTTKPTAVGRGRDVYVSWNGATEVHAWQLEAGDSAGTLQAGEPVAKVGFETRIPRPSGSRVFAVTALDRSGKPLGRSKVVRV